MAVHEVSVAISYVEHKKLRLCRLKGKNKKVQQGYQRITCDVCAPIPPYLHQVGCSLFVYLLVLSKCSFNCQFSFAIHFPKEDFVVRC